MLPQTFATLLAFLGLVTPGPVFQLIRETQRPALRESAFREASRVALTSLVFTAASILLLGVLSVAWPNAFADVPAWLNTGEKYASSNLRLVAWTISAEVATAAGLAGAAAFLVDKLPLGYGAISKSSIWHKHFAVDLPATHEAWLKLTLNDGAQVWGWLDYYTVDRPLADREISLKGPGLAIQVAKRHRTQVDVAHGLSDAPWVDDRAHARHASPRGHGPPGIRVTFHGRPLGLSASCRAVSHR